MTIKAVLDTSILVNAFLKQDGVNAGVLLQAEEHYHLYLSEAILEEAERVLLTYQRIRKKYHYSDEEANEYLFDLRLGAYQILSDLPRLDVIKKDPKDNPILACALKAKAHYIVSKDEHLRELQEYEGVKIVSSEEFLEVLKK